MKARKPLGSHDKLSGFVVILFHMKKKINHRLVVLKKND